jgi:hypothetical protein
MTLREAILDALIDDGESIIQIKEYLNYLGLESTEVEIIEILNNLFIEGQVKVAYPRKFKEKSLKEFKGEITELWFELTTKGRKEWSDIKA